MWLKILWRGDSIVGHHAFLCMLFCRAPNYNTIKKCILQIQQTTQDSIVHLELFVTVL